MNEIKKCPFCGSKVKLANMNHGLSNRGYEVQFSILCNHCNLRFGNEISEYIVNENGQTETIEDGASKLIEQWNKRAEEPQEKKETRFERLLKEGQRADKLVCCLAYRDKYKGKDCATEICGECEFCDCENAINYLLAPYEKTDNEKN